MKKSYVLLLIIGGLLGGCATPMTQRSDVNNALVELEAKKQREMALATQIKRQERLMRVSYPILVSSAPMCDDKVRPSMGIIYANKYVFPKDFQDTAITAYGLGEVLQITQVMPGGPAAKDGLQKGDIIIKMGEHPAPTGEKAATAFYQLIKEHAKPGEAIRFVVMRMGQQITVQVTPENICDYPIVMSDGDEVNAYADGTKVVITKGMMRFTEDDQELSLVVAHELAHNTMQHIKAKEQNYVLGSILDILASAYGVNTQGAFGKAAAQAYSQEFEAEADYVGLYLLARTGLPIENAPFFWRRMAAENPGSIQKNHAASHPASPERFVAMEKTIEEIKRKIEQGRPLEPEYKKKPKVSPAQESVE